MAKSIEDVEKMYEQERRVTHDEPVPSTELQVLTCLHARMNLSTKESLHFGNLQKGYAGEMKFYQKLCKFSSANRLLLFDLLLDNKQTEFQIDSIMITKNTIFLFEVKNFSGDFYVDGDYWRVVGSNKEIRNPLLQLQRTEFLFKQLLLSLNVNIPVKSFVVFVHEEFKLYQSPLGEPIIYPSQLNRFMEKLNNNLGALTNRHRQLAQRLISMHKKESMNSRLPYYDFNDLRKGIACKNCADFLIPITNFKLTCPKCEWTELIDSAIMRATREFALLFPDEKITTTAIYDWTGAICSKKVIRRILMENMKTVGSKRHTHYIFHHE